jgi:hypothetical protein
MNTNSLFDEMALALRNANITTLKNILSSSEDNGNFDEPLFLKYYFRLGYFCAENTTTPYQVANVNDNNFYIKVNSQKELVQTFILFTNMNIYNLLNIDSFKSINDDGNFKYLTTLNSFKLFKILNSLTNDKSELDLTNLTELHKLSAKEILDDIALGETNAAMKVVYCPKVLYILHELCRNDEEMLLETLDDNLSGIVLHSSSLDQRMFLTNENAYNKFLNNNEIERIKRNENQRPN